MKTNWSKYSSSGNQIGFSDSDVVIEMAVHLTNHAADRAVQRDGKPVGLTKDMIQQIVDKAESKILQIGKKFSTIILKTKDAINIVGALSSEAGQPVFDVITVMIKKNFVPNNAFDKIVYVNESASASSMKLVDIINKIENERLRKTNLLQEFYVGRKISYHKKQGKVITVSQKQTSVIVEFTDKTRQRFFINKRKDKLTVDDLSLGKLI